MEGYKVVSADEKEVGEVVGRLGDSVVIEHGLLRKKKHALPLAFASADDDAQVVRTTLSKEMIESSPEVHDLDVDEAQIAVYYGLAEPEDDTATEGYDEVRAAEEERAAIREEVSSGEGPLDRGSSPGITGGDRYRDAER